MNEIQVNSTEELIRQLNELPNHYIYRGEADASRPLQSSLERVIGQAWSQETAEKFEKDSVDLFKSKFHLYDRENVSPTSKLAWLSIMQHYGVPTRLLDFTESPYVALYFALEAYQPQSRKSLAVYALDYTAVMQRSIDFIKSREPSFSEDRKSVHDKQDEVFERVLEPGGFEVVWAAEPKQFNARLDRQAGCFLLSGTKSKKLAEVLASDTYRGCDFKKFVIHPDLYPSIFALLRKMNITSKSIYGNLDGLARSIKMQMQIYASPQPVASSEAVIPLFTRIESVADLSPRHRRWNGNDRTQRNHHGAVRISNAPFEVVLTWKASPAAPSKPVGSYRLNLPALLAAGYIRRDSRNGYVRVRFFHDHDDSVYLEVRSGAPRLLVGKVAS